MTAVRPQPIRPRQCPRCKATYDLKLGGPAATFDETGTNVRCFGCGYEGPRVEYRTAENSSPHCRPAVRLATQLWNNLPRRVAA